jgi:tol-pal system beta propeller repeat protein TolB
MAALGTAASLVFCGGQPSRVEGQAVWQDKILYIAAAGDKNSDVFVTTADGSSQTNLTQSDTPEIDPAWSPDGKQIAYAVVNRNERKADIYTMNADGKEPKKLTTSDALACAPHWSPDGKRLMFTTLKLPMGMPPKLSFHAMDADGKNVKELGDGMGNGWSPDGKKILFTALKLGGGEDISLNVMDADGGNVKQLTSSGKAGFGAWSLDGKKIVYMAEGGGNQPDVFVMNPDGTGQMQLTSTQDQQEFGPQWTADGKRIIFTRMSRGDRKGQVWVMDANGQNAKQLISGDASCFFGSVGFFVVREGG